MADDRAPTSDIEITPAMIKAGSRELAAYDAEFESIEEATARIFRAMIRTAPHDSERLEKHRLGRL